MAGWGASTVNVTCYDGAGNGSDTRFTLLYTKNAQDRFAWADQPTAASYTPSASYAANPGGSAPTATRAGAGVYTVTFGGQSLTGGNVQVSGYGSKAVCNVASWGGTNATVTCYDRNGTATDSRFTVHHSKRTS